ncbi:MAG: hypothetical protein CMH79_06215 [Nitrospinae bacterium]|nr:hypothetical protein [Nitrospinota bacterium]|tara:strand:- start:3738 stop:4169 length:432 start_codon:yes stop_codon:yes gene_type:complete
MSSLNINQLYETIDEKNNKRLNKFDEILQKIHKRIKYNAGIEKTYCFFQIPEFIIGVPLYNVDDLKKYIINSLERDGFRILYVDPNWLFINWDIRSKKNMKEIKKKQPVKKKEYKLIDEYKPSGNFINELDLSLIENKSKQLI